ncbi:DUF1992 domain-containing protein [Desulfolutivibrio sulfoxidireducens]|uniref:DnaJ family domain-containing protein n=1 Tax=Desulfolutivibrio sulfoxidireducens TaxID=2773299 RepID=UPI00159E27C5|nr:DUF1992 domain-containing protein [Desulfolutivibrio sulfoxidireducens]
MPDDDDLKAADGAAFRKEWQKDATRAEYKEYLGMRDRGMPEGSGVDIVEAKIRRAMAEGQFDNLEGQGKKLDLKGYFDAPEHLRVGYHFLRNAGFVPEEVRLSKEIEVLKERLASAKTEQDKREIRQKIAKASMDYGFYMDYNRKFAKKLF